MDLYPVNVLSNGFKMKKYLILLLLASCHSSQDLNVADTKKETRIVAAKKADINLEKKVKFKKKVSFAFDSSSLSLESRKNLTDNIIWLKQNPKKDVVIQGHCDERGTREYNLALGERRGYAVKRFLTNSGISKRRVKVVSYGEEKPVSLGSSERAHAKNRRAQLIVK